MIDVHSGFRHIPNKITGFYQVNIVFTTLSSALTQATVQLQYAKLFHFTHTNCCIVWNFVYGLHIFVSFAQQFQVLFVV